MDYMPLPKRGRLWSSKAEFFKPFRNAASEAGENITPLFDPNLPLEEPKNADLRELNSALTALVEVFPDVQPEVFREMLTSMSEESRLQVVTEHLLQKKAKWVRGRYRTPPKHEARKRRKRSNSAIATAEPGALDHEDMFRSENYRKAVKQVFYQEFRNLSHSTIKGVLAEQNFSYTMARPVLQQLASKSWRFSLSNLWAKRSPSNVADGHPYIIWQTNGSVDGVTTPAVRRTGSSELDRELYELFVAPTITRQKQDLFYADYATATELNEAEAEAADALYDCECCYSSVPFESIATCDDACHYLCLECIRRTVNEALYGQGWARTADLNRATVRCFSPSSQGCVGSIPWHLVHRALTRGGDNEDAWQDFQARVTSDTLLKSGLPLQRCPFCSYAELDDPSTVKMRRPLAVWQHVANKTAPAVQILFLSFSSMLILFTLPLLLLTALTWLAMQTIPTLHTKIHASITRIHTRRRGTRFHCRNPTCSKPSCTRCTAPWTDPHTCFETEQTSLRTAIEASATAAVKRTCPKCLLSFVKASGCNKLVCNCGYTMCYVCRQEITSREGYAHFCQHFRPSGGRCTDCERCDLYGDEDEEKAIRAAAEGAERAWREKEGKGEEGAAAKVMIEALVGRQGREWWEIWLDGVVDALIE